MWITVTLSVHLSLSLSVCLLSWQTSFRRLLILHQYIFACQYQPLFCILMFFIRSVFYYITVVSSQLILAKFPNSNTKFHYSLISLYWSDKTGLFNLYNKLNKSSQTPPKLILANNNALLCLI